MPPRTRDPSPGAKAQEVIGGRYIKKSPLGSGTYGQIYLAQDTNTNENVVVKEVDMTTMEQYEPQSLRV